MIFNVGVDLHKTQFTYCCRGVELMFGKCPITPEGYEQFLKKMKQICTDGGRVQLAVESSGNTRFFKRQMIEARFAVTVITL